MYSKRQNLSKYLLFVKTLCNIMHIKQKAFVQIVHLFSTIVLTIYALCDII